MYFAIKIRAMYNNKKGNGNSLLLFTTIYLYIFFFSMKLKCSQKDLTLALSIVNRAVNPNNTLPVLNNILIKAENSKLFLSATNLEIALHAEIDANVENEGALTMPAKILTSYVALLNDESVELEALGDSSIELRSTGSVTKMKGIPKDEFPAIPKLDNPQLIKLPAQEIKEALEQIVFVASVNISRPVLTGTLWLFEGKSLKIVATDSYRLAEKTIELEKETSKTSFIVPAKTAQELAKILASMEAKDFELHYSKNQIMFKVAGVELVSRLIEGAYPDYEKILPKVSKTKAVLELENFTLALKKLSILVKENNNSVKIRTGDDRIIITSDETQVGKGLTEIPAKITGENCEVALNVQYILDALAHMGDQTVNFSLNDGLSPVILSPQKESGYLHIIMPLKT